MRSLALVLLVACASPRPVPPPALRNASEKPSTTRFAKLDENVTYYYKLWLEHRHRPRAEIEALVARGARGPTPTHEELEHIEAARLVVKPVLPVSIDVHAAADVTALEAAGYTFWEPRGEPHVVFDVDTGLRVWRAYIEELDLDKLERLAANPRVIRVWWAPISSMRAYQNPYEPNLE